MGTESQLKRGHNIVLQLQRWCVCALLCPRKFFKVLAHEIQKAVLDPLVKMNAVNANEETTLQSSGAEALRYLVPLSPNALCCVDGRPLPEPHRRVPFLIRMASLHASPPL